MKRALLFAAALLMFFTRSASPSYAQQYDEWALLGSALAGEKWANFKMDFSDAVIEGASFQEFKEEFKFDGNDWDAHLKEITGSFLKILNNYTRTSKYRLRIGDLPDANITLILKYKSISKGGSKIKAQFIAQSKTGEILFTHDVSSNEGRVGSFTNLMSDSLEEMAEYLGPRLKKYIR